MYNYGLFWTKQQSSPNNHLGSGNLIATMQLLQFLWVRFRVPKSKHICLVKNVFPDSSQFKCKHTKVALSSMF